MATVPVITIDGPAASGKGAAARGVADKLQFHYLDSGKIYRAFTLYVLDNDVAVADEATVNACAKHFVADESFFQYYLRQPELDAENTSLLTSKVSSYAAVRQRLKVAQLAHRQPPGLVADGRDMGSQIFKDAVLKIYLTADSRVRAQRRHKQYTEKGVTADFAKIWQDIKERDWQDSNRSHSPLQQTAEMQVVESSDLTVAEVVATIVNLYLSRG